jgi:cytochrome P450
MDKVFTADQLSTPEVIANPYPAYSHLRGQSPLSLVIPAGLVPGVERELRVWVFLKYRDVYGALRDHETFSSERHPALGTTWTSLPLLEDDPPRHTRFRRLVNKAFTVRRIEALKPWITGVAEELVDAFRPDGTDVIEHYAVPLPVKVIARMLGIPGSEYATFKRWSDTFMSTLRTDRSPLAQSTTEMMTYFGKMAADRRTQGAEDLITALVEAEVDGEKLQEWEILGFCILLLIAGNETTTNLIGNMLGILAERPELWEQLRHNRDLREAVIEETLRFESPVQRLYRKTIREAEVSGIKISAGDLVSIRYGAANRDPDEFPHPDEFRLDRDLRSHVAFGMGIHYCLGAPLARAEAAITLDLMLDRFSSLKSGSTPAVRQTASDIIFGYARLPLVFAH